MGDQKDPNANHINDTIYYPTVSEERREVLDQHIRYRKINVIAEMKVYRVISSIWRHPRPLLSQIITTCAGLMCRKRLIELLL